VRSRSPFHQLDQNHNLPLHIALQNVCDTNLGVTGERKLIKFLLNLYPQSAMMTDCNGKLPIVLAIENGWPVYDIISNACPVEYTQGKCNDEGNVNAAAAGTDVGTDVVNGKEMNIANNMDTVNTHPTKTYDNLLLHDVLSCKFHPRFGVSGARSLVKFILKKFPSSIQQLNKDGCLPLHIGIANGWPCHDLLVSAAPSALEVKDPKTGFYPFLTAAHADIQVIHNEDKQLTELSALYELIRWGPLLLKGVDNGNGKTATMTTTTTHSSLNSNPIAESQCNSLPLASASEFSKTSSNQNHQRSCTIAPKRKLIDNDDEFQSQHQPCQTKRKY
jgi:hypothetical protein